jgi:hypothetical protein
MLQSVSWSSFFRALLLVYILYYAAMALLLYYPKVRKFLRHRGKVLFVFPPAMLALLSTGYSQTADGSAGLEKANSMIRGYFDTGVQILYAVGALVALIGAGSVYSHMNTHSRQDIAKEAAGWFGSCIFLVIVATVIKSFFGV